MEMANTEVYIGDCSLDIGGWIKRVDFYDEN